MYEPVRNNECGALIMYTNAQYTALNGTNTGIRCNINGVTSFVPLDPANTDYQNIMQLVDAGELTIAPADEPKANTGN
jgi:hypothetical protein